MDNTIKNVMNLWESNPGIFLLIGFTLFVGIVGSAKLFAKADKPWYAALVPVWNIAVVLQMVGRPTSHLAYFLIPFFNVYFFFKLHIELAQSFGKYNIVDYILVCIFNVFYLLNLGLAYNEEYVGPSFGKNLKDVQAHKPALV